MSIPAREIGSALAVADSLRLVHLEKRVRELEAAVNARSTIVPINTFAPEPYEILNRIEVVVEPMGEEFMATFFDANISAAGETDQEAVENVKAAILDTFDSLSGASTDTLGPEPLRQRELLQHLLRRQQNHGTVEQARSEANS